MKYLMTKKVLCHKTKNLNWEFLTKNLLLKDGIGLRMKYYGGSLKNAIGGKRNGGGVTKNQ